MNIMLKVVSVIVFLTTIQVGAFNTCLDYCTEAHDKVPTAFILQ